MKRSTYYAAIQNKPDKYESEKELIKQIFHHHKGRYGYRRITVLVRRAGFALNHKTVKRLNVMVVMLREKESFLINRKKVNNV